MSEYGKLPYRELEDYSNMQAAQIRKKNNKIEQLHARVKKLEAINLGLTKTLVDMAAEKATLVEALEQGFPLLRDEGLDEVEHHCEWVIQRERKRVHSILAAHRSRGGE